MTRILILAGTNDQARTLARWHGMPPPLGSMWAALPACMGSAMESSGSSAHGVIGATPSIASTLRAIMA